MRKSVLAAVIAASGGFGLAPALAQDLQMVGPPAEAGVAAPARGMSMAAVEQRFGAPAERFAAVGQPPISRWVYPDFVVFFEYQHVVHAVTNRAASATR